MSTQDAMALPLAALEAYLAQHLPGFAGPLAAEKFKGGQSNPTYRLDWPGGRCVLRRKPLASIYRGLQIRRELGYWGRGAR